MNLAVIWMRFGPYHVARLRAFSRTALARNVRVTGIQVASRDHYEWEKPSIAGAAFDLRTLFEGVSYSELPTGAILRAVWNELSDCRPDLVAINGWSAPEALSALVWTERYGVPCVLMSETQRHVAKSHRSPWRELLKRSVVRRFDSALVGGRLQAAYLGSLGFASGRIFYGYDAIDNQHFSSGALSAGESADHLRAEHSLPERYFIACTRLLPRKNVDGLLRAYTQYLDRSTTTPWGLVIVGSGEEREKLHRLARDLGIAHLVCWLGFRQYHELPIFYRLASAFVHVPLEEAWGLVVNEAAATGLPVIVGDKVGAAAELVRDRENGWLVVATSTSSISDAMLECASLSPSKFSAMGWRSRELVSHWGPERFASGLWQAANCALGGALTTAAA